MIIRIVRMTFREDSIDEFLLLFQEVNKVILNFPGCRHLELWQDHDDKRRIFTYSHWDYTSDLDNYRNSLFFKETWSRTKILFQESPQAWTVHRIAGATEKEENQEAI